MSWILDLGSIGKFGEEVGRLGGLVAGGTRAEHWPKSKECLPRLETHIALSEGRGNTAFKQHVFMILTIL
jgi:hypothetical protein